MHPKLWVLVLLLLASRQSAAESNDSSRPLNLIIIQTDEHNFRTLGCYRDLLPENQAFIWGPGAAVETPAIDAIARSGAICTSFYATSPVCTPSRASFFSGLYPQNTGSPQNDLPLNNDVVTFAKILNENGYATGYAGKWHLDGNGKPQWAPSRNFGFGDNRYMFNRGHWKKFELTSNGPRVAASKNGKPTYNLASADEKSFSTDWLTDRLLDFIEEHASDPFCYHLSLPDPHGPNTVRPPYDMMYTDMVIRPPLTFGKSENNPKWGDASGKNSAGKFRADLMSQYFGMVRCIDDNVARVLNKLKDLGIDDRTALVFTSDHGDLCYEHGRLNKGNPYEGSARIPMIIAVPGKINAGTVVNEALGTVDFSPTILSLLGYEPPAETQGRNFERLLTGDNSDWEDVTILRNAGRKAVWIAAVTSRYKLVVSTIEAPWLFDLESDPDELLNAIDKADHRPVTRRLAQAIEQYGKKFDDPYLEDAKIQGQLVSLLSE